MLKNKGNITKSVTLNILKIVLNQFFKSIFKS